MSPSQNKPVGNGGRNIPSLRLPGEFETDFVHRIKRTAKLVQILIDACLSNKCVQEYIADPTISFFTETALRTSPIVRVEYDQAFAIGGIGETLDATRSKSWGDGPYILPLQRDDWFYAERITYIYREHSLYNRRFEQRRRLKELLGKPWRKLVETAKGHTKTIFLRDLNSDQAQAICRNIGVEPDVFWRAAKGRIFLDLPPRLVQQEFDFEAINRHPRKGIRVSSNTSSREVDDHGQDETAASTRDSPGGNQGNNLGERNHSRYAAQRDG